MNCCTWGGLGLDYIPPFCYMGRIKGGLHVITLHYCKWGGLWVDYILSLLHGEDQGWITFLNCCIWGGLGVDYILGFL